MANWKKILTTADDASYSNSSIEAGDIPTLNQDTTGESGTSLLLANTRSFRTRLGNTSLVTFNGGTNCFPGVEGTLAVGNGGTGATSASAARANLGLPIEAGAGAGAYGSTSDGTKIDTITLDAYGRVTAVATGGTGSTSNAGDITNVTAGTNLSGGGTSGSVTINLASASSLGKGAVELATTAETTTGTDPNRAVTPDGLKDGYQGSANVTTVGAISSGEWRGTAIDGAYVSTLNQNTTGSSASCTGTAANATVLSNTRTFRTNLASTSTSNFNGSQNPTPGVTGTLPVSNGGTGQTGATGTGKLVLWDSPNLLGSPIIGGTTFPSSTGTAKQILQNNGLGSATWVDNYPDNVKYFYQQWSMRWYMRYGYAYYPSTSYGPGYYNWNKYSISPITAWQDSWNLGYVVPEGATFKGAELLGSTNNTETLQLKILKGTPSSYSNSSTSVTIGSIYAPTAASFTSGRRKSMGSTSAVSVSVSKGDIIVPQLNKTSNLSSSTTRYLYGTLVLKFQKA